jgi:ribosomal protein S18 acetylase RimI-like enzyme
MGTSAGGFCLETRAVDIARDRDFLLRVFGETRPELALLGLDAERLEQLLRVQWELQQASYRARYPGAQHDLVLMDGAPAGQLLVARSPLRIVLVDIALTSVFCGRGIGAALLGELISEAQSQAVALELSVRPDNRALRLYRRLGFVDMGGDSSTIRMCWGERSRVTRTELHCVGDQS